jgi:1,4-dihydroxy-2-naphthoate octaprenyltransferase
VNAWLTAARPATLLAVVAPVLVGTGLAVNDGVFHAGIFAAALAAALLMNIGVNFANDLSDAKRGADADDRTGPVRAVASGLIDERSMKIGIGTVFGAASMLGIYLATEAGWIVLVIGATAMLAAFTYTGGPFPYGYHGFGEIGVFVFFGLVATVGTRYLYDSTAPAAAWLLAVPVGMLAVSILVTNNIRDLDTDNRAGKRTLAVILGRRHTRLLYTVLLAGAFLLLLEFSAAGWVPRASALGLFALPLAVFPWWTVVKETSPAALISALKATAILHACFGVLVAVGAAL